MNQTIFIERWADMKRIGIFLMLIIMCIAIACPVSALSGARQIRNETVVSGDGSCRVLLSVSFTLEQPVPEPVFPIPSNATDVIVNGSPISVFSGGKVPLKDITGGMAGDFSLSISYNLPSVVSVTSLRVAGAMSMVPSATCSSPLGDTQAVIATASAK